MLGTQELKVRPGWQGPEDLAAPLALVLQRITTEKT